MRCGSTLLLALVALGGCGYHLVNARAPFGLRRVAVVPFVEDEIAGISADLAQELATELGAMGVDLTADRGSADAVLAGHIVSARTYPIVSPKGILSYQVSVVVLATLTKASKEVWRSQIEAHDDFPPTAQPASEPGGALVTEASRRMALHRAAQRAAREIRERLVLAAAAQGA